MSSPQLKKFAEAYIRYSLEKDPKTTKDNPDSYGRWMSMQQHGQILIIPKKLLYAVIDNTTSAFSTPHKTIKKLPAASKNKVYRQCKAYVKEKTTANYRKWGAKSQVAQNVTETFKYLKKNRLIPRGAIVGFVTNFEQIKYWKRTGLTDIIVTAIEAHLTKENLKPPTAKIRSVIMEQTDVGHGEFGRSATQTTMGRAQEKALSEIDVSQLKSGEREKIEQFQINIDRTLKSNITHSMAIDDKGNFAKGYATVNSLQLSETNRKEDALIESSITAWARTQAKKYVDDGTSTRMTTAIERVLLSALTGQTRKAVRVQITGEKPAKSIRETSKASASRSVTFKRKVKAMTMAEPFDLKAAASKLKSKSKQKRGPALSIGSLIAILNQDLGKTVQDNMVSPALRNRTGTFAGGVKVLNVVQNQKFPTFQYTYDRYRYGRFEGTEPWSDGGNRDPRKLIDKSVREIAAELAIGRFYTQRI